LTIFAKSRPQKETIPEHTSNLEKAYENLVSLNYINQTVIDKYDTVIRRIIYYHDLGKLNHKFQNKLKLAPPIVIKELKDREEVPHEWLSIAFISDEDKELFKQYNEDNVLFLVLVQYCIAYHHTRNKAFSADAIKAFVEHDLEKRKGLLEIRHPLKSNYNIEKDFAGKIFSPEYFKHYFKPLVFLKGMLHKCDYAASAAIEPEKRYEGDYRNDFTRWLPFTLKPFQDAARNHSDKSIVLVASTGMGKTEYAMNWIDGSKAFFLLGIRIAVNEMFKRFTNVFKENNVALLHGETSFFLATNDNNDDDDYNTALARIRQFSFPLTIATADQLVTSVFKYNGFELAYFTASYSKIVVDEIQSFAPEAIAAIVVFLKEIHSLGGRFLLMTATLPPFVRQEFEKLPDVIVPPPQYLDKRRHRIKLMDNSINSQATISLIKKECKHKKVLIICNTVAKAQEMHDALVDIQPQLIHARFIGRDRKKKETEIMKASAPCVWISTQIVEASLDIDFDVLFTECASIESLFQRFGRCFRKRDYDADEPNVYIFASDPSRIYDHSLFNKTWEILREYNMRLLDEETKQMIIEKVFSGIESKYYERYKNMKNLLELGYRSESRNAAQKEFRTITNSHIIIPEPVYNDERDRILTLIKDIDSIDNNLKEKIKKQVELREYTVGIQLFNNKEKLLKPINGSEYCKRHSIMIMKGVSYSVEKGMEFIKDYKDYDNFIL
jgi:CRISPR-associated endonuclease/helicase Cas3